MGMCVQGMGTEYTLVCFGVYTSLCMHTESFHNTALHSVCTQQPHSSGSRHSVCVCVRACVRACVRGVCCVQPNISHVG